MKSSNNNPIILIAEDDPDQMSFLVDLARTEIKNLINDENTRDEQRHEIKDIKVLPNTPITMISSLNRFHKTVTQHYAREHALSINFISKSDFPKISRNVGYYLRQHIAA